MQPPEVERGPDGLGSNERLRSKLKNLEAWLGRYERAAVAFSGGVDSAFLLAVARRVLGEGAVAFTAVSPSLAPEELAGARRLAREFGCELLEVETGEMQDSRYRENGPDRCFHCKTHLFTKVGEVARRRGIEVVLDGNNRDDASDYRPGLKASRDLGVRSPLMEVGFSKHEIRALAREMKLGVWNKPASPCLASRIPYFSPVTETKLKQVGDAERLLRNLGFPVVRVRHHGEVARIEVEEARLPDLLVGAVRQKVEAGLRALGFEFVTVDLGGYRSGKLNRMLTETDT